METLKIIGFCGPKRSGKDTAAKMFVDAKRFEFARPLKEATMALFGLTHDQVYDEKLKETIDPRYGKTPRQLLQWLGTDVIRDQFNKDHLLLLMRDSIANTIVDGGIREIVITDVRFDNEAELIRGFGGTIIEIVRPLLLKVDSHPSEAGISRELIHFSVINHGVEEEQLWDEVHKVVYS